MVSFLEVIRRVKIRNLNLNKIFKMTIDLQNSKKKHPNFVCLSVSAASKFVSGEYTCKSGLK